MILLLSMENPLDDSTAVVAFATDDAAVLFYISLMVVSLCTTRNLPLFGLFCWQIGTLVLCRKICSKINRCKSAEQFLEWSAVFLMVSAECNSPRAIVYDWYFHTTSLVEICYTIRNIITKLWPWSSKDSRLIF